MDSIVNDLMRGEFDATRYTLKQMRVALAVLAVANKNEPASVRKEWIDELEMAIAESEMP